MDILDQPEPEKKQGRPLAISLICILSFLGAALSLPSIYNQTTIYRQVEAMTPEDSRIIAYLWITTVVGLLSMIGLWKMKKWGAYAYTIMAITNQVVLQMLGSWSLINLLIPAIVVGFALAYLPRMD